MTDSFRVGEAPQGILPNPFTLRTFRRAGTSMKPLGPMGMAMILLLAGCAGKKGPSTLPNYCPPPPQWVLTGEAPEPSGLVCAIGVAEPTYFRSHGITQAEEQARGELARTLTVSIRSGMIDIQTESGGQKSSQTILEVSAYANEVVLQGSQIKEVWFDETGLGFAQKPECTYALACIASTAIKAGLSPH